MSNDSMVKTIVVALGICFICSILVSTAAVALKPRQDSNRELDKLKNILSACDLYQPGIDVKQVFQSNIESKIIELKTGEAITEDKYNEVLSIDGYDIKKVAKHPEYGVNIKGKSDIARIKRKPKFVLVYFQKQGESIDKVVLPIYGKGLWSTMYGFIALGTDLRTVRGFTFYEHGETPGLGGEVDNPRWKKQWQGKQAFDQDNNLMIKVIKGLVDRNKEDAKYQIDGLSGSTLTTKGVNDLVRFWLGELGYGPLLKKLRQEGTNG